MAGGRCSPAPTHTVWIKYGKQKLQQITLALLFIKLMFIVKVFCVRQLLKLGIVHTRCFYRKIQENHVKTQQFSYESRSAKTATLNIRYLSLWNNVGTAGLEKWFYGWSFVDTSSLILPSGSDLLVTVLRIHDILARILIRIRRSVPLTKGGSDSGSGSCSFRH